MSKETSRYLLTEQDLADYYVASNAASVLQHAQKLVGKTLRPYLNEDQIKHALSPRGKGDFGNLLEEAYFKIRSSNESGPDIPESGIELKSAQLKMLTRPIKKVFKERLKVSMIDYHRSFENEVLQNSHLWAKLEKILLMLFMWDQEARIDQKCVWVDFLEWDDSDIKQMTADWSLIRKTVLDGRADQLSEGMTWYLGACTAGANASSLRSAPGGISAKARAFSLKQPFLDYKLGFRRSVKGMHFFEPPKDMTLDEYLIQGMRGYYGQTLDQIVRKIGRPNLLARFAKNMNSKISRALLEEIASKSTVDVDTDFAQFRKSGVIEKTITLESNNRLKECVSFPAFKWMELYLEDEWEDSELYQILTTKFFFTILRKVDGTWPLLLGTFFWSMPEDDLEKMKTLWLDTKEKVARNDYDHFLRKSQHGIGHVRPHARDSNDTYITPQRTYRTKKSFWLNNDYILKVIKMNLSI